MPVIIFDGPEAAGKTTLIKRVFARTDQKVVRRWGPVDSIDVYRPFLMHDLGDPGTVVWDRSWASEYVYNKLLHRDRPIFPELQKLEDVVPVLKVMVLVDPAVAAVRRYRRLEAGQTSDLPVDPYEEHALFYRYAQHHGWAIIDPLIGGEEKDVKDV